MFIFKKIIINPIEYFVWRKLKKFKNIHNNEKCVIFGDGPSLKYYDLKEFKNYTAICVGMLPFHKDQNELNLKYLVLLEPFAFAPKIFQKRYLYGIRHIIKEYKKKFYKKKKIYLFTHLSNYPWIRSALKIPLWNGLFKNNIYLKEFRFKKPFEGSFYAAIWLAVFMGFKKILFVGFDGWLGSPLMAGHWYEKGPGYTFKSNKIPLMHLRKINPSVKLFGLETNKKINRVKSISYKTLCGKRKKYRENNELLSKASMKTLS